MRHQGREKQKAESLARAIERAKRGAILFVLWKRTIIGRERKKETPPSSNAVILISDRFGCSHHEQTLGCSYPDSEGAL